MRKVKPPGTDPSSFDLLDFFVAQCDYKLNAEGKMQISITVPRSFDLEMSSRAKRRAALVSAYHSHITKQREILQQKRLAKSEGLK